MQPYDSREIEYEGYTVTINLYVDEHMGPPWEEHDGHGPVSEWTTRDKAPGEWILCSDRRSHRYYDAQEATKIAKRDGWGFEGMDRKTMTAGQIAEKAVKRDFDYLRRWCDNQWQWIGYDSTIETPEGDEIDGPSCWGFDDEEDMIEDATDSAKWHIDNDKKKRIEDEIKRAQLQREYDIAICWP